MPGPRTGNQHATALSPFLNTRCISNSSSSSGPRTMPQVSTFYPTRPCHGAPLSREQYRHAHAHAAPNSGHHLMQQQPTGSSSPKPNRHAHTGPKSGHHLMQQQPTGSSNPKPNPTASRQQHPDGKRPAASAAPATHSTPQHPAHRVGDPSALSTASRTPLPPSQPHSTDS